MLKRSFFGLVAAAALVSACSGEIGGASAGARQGPAPGSGSAEGAADPTDLTDDPFPQDDPTCSSAAAVVGASDGWQSRQASEPAFETLEFEVMARPEAANIDALVAVGSDDISDFSDGAMKVRFADDGFIDARDGSVYDSDVAIAYEPGVWYTLMISADIASRTYDVEVARCGEPPEPLITGAAFESEAAVSDQLTTWAAWSSQSAKLDVATPSWVSSGSCAPATCPSLGVECGEPSNGCGSSLSCGGCGSGQTCGSGGICIDISSPPPPRPLPPLPGDGTDRPWANNTGPTNVGALVPSGSITISTDGAVVENLDVTGQITVTADNVTIRNFRIDASGSWYGLQNSGGSNLVIEDGEVFGSRSAGVLGSNLTARRLYLHDHGGDALKVGSNSLVEYCFIEKNGTNADAHADGNQTRGGSNITFRYNNIWMPSPGTSNYPGTPYKSNAAFMLELGISNFVVENNWLNGGTYTVYCPSPEMSGVIVRNNRFGRDYQYGLRAGNCAEWSGNVWDNNGNPTP